jgi:hypothetical protein
LQLSPSDSTIEDSTGEDLVDRKMTIPKGKTRYQFIIFIHEILFLFLSLFLSFPSHIKRIILCFVYSYDNRPSFIYPSLEEENIPSSCVVDTDLVCSPLPIHKSEICIASPLEIDHPCSHEEVENNSHYSQTSLPSFIPAEPCHQLVNPHDQPTAFQIKIKDKLFKPLRLLHDLHPYPHYSFEYLPQFSGEDHVTCERHLGAFEKFVDQFEIDHDDVIMMLFSKSLSGDVVMWFRCLESSSIGSWTELCHAFLKCSGENKSHDQYRFEFNALRTGEEEALVVFNRRFCSVYHSMPMEIKPIETDAMVYYVMAHHLELVLLLRERKFASLRHLFEDVEEVEENIRARKGVHMKAYLEKLHVPKEEYGQHVSHFEQEDSDYESNLDQQQGKETATVDDRELFLKEQGVFLFANREAFTEEQPGLLKQPGFYHTIHDPMAIYMESYVLYFEDFQEHTTEPFPLYIEEKHCVEIFHSVPTEDKEKRFQVVLVYDDYDSDPWESHEEEEGELNVQFISCPEPVNKQISPGIGQPALVLHPPIHFENIKQRMRNNEEHEVISYQLSSPDCKFCDPVGHIWRCVFKKNWNLQNYSSYHQLGVWEAFQSMFSFYYHNSLAFLGSVAVKIRNLSPDDLGGYGGSFLSPSTL